MAAGGWKRLVKQGEENGCQRSSQGLHIQRRQRQEGGWASCENMSVPPQPCMERGTWRVKNRAEGGGREKRRPSPVTARAPPTKARGSGRGSDGVEGKMNLHRYPPSSTRFPSSSFSSFPIPRAALKEQRAASAIKAVPVLGPLSQSFACRSSSVFHRGGKPQGQGPRRDCFPTPARLS